MHEKNKETTREIVRRFDEERSKRGQLDEHLEDISRVLSPRRQGFTTIPEDGDRRNDEIFDGTGMQAKRSLANTLGVMIRPEGEVFAKVKAEDDSLENNDDAKKWLADSTERLDTAIRNPKARLRQAAGEVDDDLVALGTGVMFMGESQIGDHLLFQSLYLGNTYPLWNDEGNTDGIFARKTLRLWQAEQRFGLENLSEKSQEIYKQGKIDEKITCLRAILPRKQMRVKNPIFARNMPWSDKWIEPDQMHVIAEGGHMEFPFIAPRWDTSSGEDYGRSPGMVALPDVNTSQAMQETMLVAGQRNTDPPLMAPNDGSFDALNTFPGGISYYDVETAAALGGNPFFPLASGANLPLTREMQMDTREMILSAFFKNILNLPVNGPQMTATEIIQRKDEFVRELGAVFGRLEADYNQPIAERSFNVMLRGGAFLPIPEVLAGQRIKFEFELPITKVRKQVEAAAARMWAMEIMEFSNIKPEARHLININALAKFSHQALNLPHEILNSQEEVDALVQQDQQQMQAQQEMAAMEQMAKAAEKGAGALDKAGLTGKTQEGAAPAAP